jgi:hypothetical protein
MGYGYLGEVMPEAIVAFGVLLAAVVGLIVATGFTNVMTRPRGDLPPFAELCEQVRSKAGTSPLPEPPSDAQVVWV